MNEQQLDWRRRQAIQPAPPRYIEPTLPERINRLNPRERAEVSSLLRGMKLRKIIKRTLAEAFWRGEQQKAMNALLDSAALGSMPRLRAAVHSRESLTSYEHALTTFEPTITTSEQPIAIEVPR